MSDIYSNSNVNFLLGIIINEPILLLNDKYPLDKKDFSPCLFHKIIFATCKNLVNRGCKEIDEITISEFLSNYKTQLNIFEDNSGVEYIQTIKELTANKVDSYEYYWQNIRKHSLLRQYQDNGFDVKEIWNVDSTSDKNESELDNWTINKICDYFEKKQSGIKKEFSTNSNIEEIKLGSWFKNIKNEFMKTPMYGGTFFSEYMNTATRGWIKGQLSILSIPSGGGKSCLGIGSLVRCCCDEIWDYNKQAFVKNPCFQGTGGLYLQYEMDGEYECTPRFVGAISGVPTNHILNGLYEDGESERVDKAIEILDRCHIHIVTMPSFTTELLDVYIRDYRINYNCQYVVFDYISDQSSVNSEIARKNGTTTRIDTVLATVASVLKDIATQYDVAVMTFTQCNANIGIQEYMDAGCIAGSRAVQNKADIAGIMMPLRKKEEQLVDTFINANNSRGFLIPRPNRILHLYKVRFGSEEQGVKIWMNVDLSNSNVIDCWVTTKDNMPYKMNKTKLEGVS